MLVLTAALVRAQNTATQQQLDKLSGTIQDMLEAQALQGKRLDALEREIGELREKVNTPVVNDSASRADLKKLAEQVQELDRKRKEESEQIAKQLDNLAKAAAAAPAPPPHKPPTTSKPTTDPGTTGAVPDKGYYYEIKPGDTLGDIVKAYQKQGVKVTRAQIKQANPKMNPDMLIAGKKIFIPDPAAKQ